MESKKNKHVPLGLIDTDELDKSLEEFTASINRQYQIIKESSFKIVVNKTIKEENLEDHEIELLKKTNYELSALKGDQVILFDKPYLVSEVTCYKSQSFLDDKVLGIRFLSRSKSTKKVVLPTRDANKNLLYEIDDVVLGFILPSFIEFSSAKVLDLEVFYRKRSIIAEIQKAHEDLMLSIDILKGSVFEKVDKTNIYLIEKESAIKHIEDQTQSSLNEKQRIEESLKKEQSILQRIRNDITHETDNIEKLQLEVSKIQKVISESRKEEDESHKSLKEVNERILTNNLKLDKSRKELSDLQSQLVEIRADVNITTLDMKGFSVETQSQISRYYWLSFFVLVFLAAVFWCLYENASTFSELFDVNPNASLGNILLSRLPLVTATTLIIATLSGLLFFLIKNIVTVSDNKMNMLKASILAEQITGSIPKSDMTEDEIRDFKRNTKIELVMNIFAQKSENIKDEKQIDTIKQMIEFMKSFKS